jgi:hypothetical protein
MTRILVCSLMSLWLRNALETVIRETPKSRAMSIILAPIFFSKVARSGLYRYS